MITIYNRIGRCVCVLHLTPVMWRECDARKRRKPSVSDKLCRKSLCRYGTLCEMDVQLNDFLSSDQQNYKILFHPARLHLLQENTPPLQSFARVCSRLRIFFCRAASLTAIQLVWHICHKPSIPSQRHCRRRPMKPIHVRFTIVYRTWIDSISDLPLTVHVWYTSGNTGAHPLHVLVVYVMYIFTR